jgi:hypothetical protein
MPDTPHDYSRYLVLYSAGADSTFFIEREPSAVSLIHYTSPNPDQNRLALINANLLNRWMTVVPPNWVALTDGETNQIHALYDTQMALDAGIRALSFRMRGIVMCFNADDIGIDFDAVTNILRRADSGFELLTPLRHMSAQSIRNTLAARVSGLKYISCMYGGVPCGFCAKCKKGY